MEQHTQPTEELVIAPKHPLVKVTSDDPGTEITVQEYTDIAFALSLLQHRHANVVYDVSTTKGIDAAKKARAELVKLRTSLEEKREEIKAPVLQRGRDIDAQAKAITAAVKALEKPIDEQITAEETRKKTEREALAKKEQDRQKALRARIVSITQLPLQAIGQPSETVDGLIQGIKGLFEMAVWEEYREEAEAVYKTSLDQLIVMLAVARQTEIQAAEAAASVAEFNRMEDERKALQKLDDDRLGIIRAMEKLPYNGDGTAQGIRKQIDVLGMVEMTQARFGQRFEEAVATKQQIITVLDNQLATRETADRLDEERRKETLRLQAEEAQRLEAERLERERKDAEEAAGFKRVQDFEDEQRRVRESELAERQAQAAATQRTALEMFPTLAMALMELVVICMVRKDEMTVTERAMIEHANQLADKARALLQ